MTNKRDATSAPDIDGFDLDDFFESGGDEWDDEFQALGVDMDIAGSSAAAAAPPEPEAGPTLSVPALAPAPPPAPAPESAEVAAAEVDLTGIPEGDSATAADAGGAGSDAGSLSEAPTSSATNTRSKQASGSTKQEKSKSSQRPNKSKKKKQQQQQQQQQQLPPTDGRTSPRLRAMAVASSPGGESDNPKVPRAATTTRGEKSKEASSRKKGAVGSGLQSTRSKSALAKKKGSVSAPPLPISSSNQLNQKADSQPSSVGSALPSSSGSRAGTVATRAQPATQQQTQRSKGTNLKSASSSSKSSPAAGSSAPDEIAPATTTSKRGLAQDRRQRQMRPPTTSSSTGVSIGFPSSSTDFPANATPLSAAPMLGTPTAVGAGGVGRSDAFGQAPPGAVVSAVDLSTDAGIKFSQGKELSKLKDKGSVDGQALGRSSASVEPATVTKGAHLGNFDAEDSFAAGGTETNARRMSGSRPGSVCRSEIGDASTPFFPFLNTPSDVSNPKNNNKTYRLLEKVNTSVGPGSDLLDLASPLASDDGTTPSSLSPEAPVYRLMSNYVKVPSPSLGVAGPPEGSDTPSLSRSLSSAKDFVSRNRASVGREVMEALTLVNRQSKFLMGNMNKMQRWCQENLGADGEGSPGSGMVFPVADLSDGALKADVVSSTLAEQGALSSSDLGGNKTKRTEFWRSGGGKAKSSAVASGAPIKVRVKVKVKCAGLKEQLFSGRLPLQAEFLSPVVPPSVPKGLFEAPHLTSLDQTSGAVPDLSVSATPILSAATVPLQVKSAKVAVSGPGESLTGNKRKQPECGKSTAESSLLEGAPGSELPADLAFEELPMSERRELLTKAWRRKGQKLAEKRRWNVNARLQSQRKRDREIARLVNEDEIKVSHTATFWKVIEQTRYLSELTDEEIAAELGDLWQPEWAEEQETYLGEVGPPRVKARTAHGREPESRSSTLYDRLQALLVEEDGDEQEGFKGDNDERDLDSILSEYSGAFPDFCGPDSSSHIVDEVQMEDSLVDVSELSHSERAYIHLRAAHLVDRRYSSTFVPRILIEEEAEGDDKEVVAAETGVVVSGDGGREGVSKNGHRVTAMELENDVEDALANMNAAVQELHRAVNWRVALLQESSITELGISEQRAMRNEDCKRLVSQHNQLLRKQETKRVNKKSGNRGDWPNTFAVQSG